MVRVKASAPSLARKKRYFKRAKGFWGGRHRLWQTVQEAVVRADAFAYRDRRVKKRDFRRLWIVRISAAVELRGMNYSSFMAGLKSAGVALNRKALSEIAIHDAAAFARLVEQARAGLAPPALS